RPAGECGLRRAPPPAGVVRLAGIAVALLLAVPVAAQQLPPSAQQAAERLRQEQDALEKLRQERADLESRMRRLQSSARDVSAERQNLERQALATSRVVRSLDQQLGSLVEEVDNVNSSLARSQDELLIKRATLKKRVQEIYKRGPLYFVEALLSAESFGALVARYKYLHLVARRDRTLLNRVQTLNDQITAQRFLLVRLRGDMEANRQQKAEEESRLRRLELQRGRTLAQLQAQAKAAEERLKQVQRDEQRLAGVIAALEDARKRVESRSGATPSSSSITTTDLGRLDWPVDGEILYRFGRAIRPDNSSIRWNGVGIKAPAGTPVKAIAAGEVVFAEPQGTYGPTVILQHGGGDYSIYSSLSTITVKRGATVAKGTVIGTVGEADPDLGPRLHLEIRRKGPAVDPLEWLRRQR
ncbi:MAG: peptidoglycan DD-metalloendopeptidase family protein, partial [Gemmatimonadota bacterium]|nr:peptidoglycan DD-metalloendopeptidase family protein [Gemmatimonadota bacterium]